VINFAQHEGKGREGAAGVPGGCWSLEKRPTEPGRRAAPLAVARRRYAGGLVCTTPEPGFGWGGREEGEFLADSGAGGVLLRGGGGDTTTESTKSSIARIPFFLISSRPPLTGGSRLAA
jgi:hypothetical protein